MVCPNWPPLSLTYALAPVPFPLDLPSLFISSITIYLSIGLQQDASDQCSLLSPRILKFVASAAPNDIADL